MKKKILGICGSTKDKSSSLSILKFVQSSCTEIVNLEIYSGIDNLPHFNPDLDNAQLPKDVVAFRKQIEAADGILFCTPEYVFSLPGSLKNAIEWTVSTTLFSCKPVAMIIAAASGQKAFEALDLIMTTIESILPDESKLLISGAKGKLDNKGKILDENVKKDIHRVIESLLKSIESNNQSPTKYITNIQ